MSTSPQGRTESLSVDPWPKVDHEAYGLVERQPLTRIRHHIARRLARNWVMIPHVTHHDAVDITELDRIRRGLNRDASAGEPKLTALPFLIRGLATLLQEFPQFNASFEANEIVLKRYYNVGIATDTERGLVVPVLSGVDGKGVRELAAEMAQVTAIAREGRLRPEQMAGGTFTVSSLGAIGGMGFTPIINAPEVAILGITRAVEKPVWDGEKFVPRLMLPLSLSYDHRVIDGADAARFTVRLGELLHTVLPAQTKHWL